MLNRAPTLHRLVGIQAFEPVLIEGEAIRSIRWSAPPSTPTSMATRWRCTCRSVCRSADGVARADDVDPTTSFQPSERQADHHAGHPSDYMTERPFARGEHNVPAEDGYFSGHFGSAKEVRMAFDHGVLHLQARIKVRMAPGEPLIRTTAGRVLLFEGGIPREIPFSMVNRALGKKELNELIDTCYRLCGQKATVLMADYLRATGYAESTKAGISICMDDMAIPDAKRRLLQSAKKEVKPRSPEQYTEGLITSGERYNKVDRHLGEVCRADRQAT
jgi:DNA-directed RNA polymerase subunit beta'